MIRSPRCFRRSCAARLAFGALMALAAAGSLSAQAHATPELAAPSRPLVVGSELDYPPFALVKPDGSADGFTVGLWKAVAQHAGLSYEFKVAPFHELLQGFKDGKVDVLINLAQSEARKQFTDFSVPHVTMYGAAFVRAGDERIRSEADLAGKSLIVVRADLVHDYAVSRGWTNLVPVDDAASAMRLLASGKHDAVLLGKLVGLETLHELGISNIRPAPTRLNVSQKFAFAVPKGNAELLARINEGLALVKADGTYDALYERWFGLLEPRRVTLADVIRIATPYLIPGLIVFLVIVVAYARQTQLLRRLARQTETLQSSQEEIRKLNAELEQRVKDRTAELEAFTYSAAHDLRAPLRAIDGYSQALLEDYGERLDGEAQSYLQRLRTASQRMGVMIDGLLALSHLTQDTVARAAVDLSSLAERIAADLRETEPKREVKFVIEPGLSAKVDPNLMRICLENLLGNAWKYTAREPHPRIQVRAWREAQASGFVVEDNGAGFDMAAADRLFEPFHRLHKESEFPGSGIGLSTVRRIIHRHEGRVWAEAAPGAGARFYVALPEAGPEAPQGD